MGKAKPRKTAAQRRQEELEERVRDMTNDLGITPEIRLLRHFYMLANQV